MQLRFALIAIISILLVAGCAAPSPESSNVPANERTVTTSPAAATTPATSAATPVISTSPAPSNIGSTTDQVTETTSAGHLANPSRSCKTSADCAIKDVGSCCGAYPSCVNINANTNPAAIKAQCAKDGMASTCGFREVRGCECVAGQCQDIADGAVVQ